jgi:CubicO group peptidase (beta-lactamase class C family)
MNSRHAVRSLISGALLTMAAMPSAFAQGSFDIPAGAHFNLQKLQRIGEFLRGEIADGKIPGAILLIQQHGKPVYRQFFGVRDVVTKLPMTDDTIFRLHSMSKPITSVAAMLLVDAGKLKLDDPSPNTSRHSRKPRSGGKGRPTTASRYWNWCR